ncbi:hypothetical protein MLD38_029793 [Melastoma candidum]|uniref:Uncharacterized protein n=1 Tax=Melastoma candidum TaxID=119954 RepID=A0ACB9N511_9MYRT|nr:hypothetical protein MLD38_029793 [Melastoma candidum]
MGDSASGRSPATDNENYLQPFFVLHKAKPQVSEAKPARRRKVDSSLGSPKRQRGNHGGGEEEKEKEINREEMRMEAFKLVWSEIEGNAKGVMEEVHRESYQAINSWVQESFNTIRSRVEFGSAETSRPFPSAVNPISKRLFTALISTRNIEMFDEQETFKNLTMHLKSSGCYVANLSSMDFTAHSGISSVLKNFLKQFITTSFEVVDLSILATWYKDQGKSGAPMVLVINDLERCHGSVLSEFILMLSDWVMKIPVMLIVGLATTVDIPRSILHSEALQHLQPCKFNLGTLGERMDAMSYGIFLKHDLGFSVSHKVASFMRDYFSSHGGTLSCFVRALKIACVQHFSTESRSIMLRVLAEENKQGKKHDPLPELVDAFCLNTLLSGRNESTKDAKKELVSGLTEVKRFHGQWRTVVLCLCDAGKYSKVHLLDLLCEALDPEIVQSSEPDPSKQSTLDIGGYNQKFSTKAKGFISQVIAKIRDLPGPTLHELLKKWEVHFGGMDEILEKLRILQHMLGDKNVARSKENAMDILKKRPSRSISSSEKVSESVNENAASFLKYLIQNYLRPIECTPFHEVVCFKDVQKLQAALMGVSRRQIQVDLIDSTEILGCTCCLRSSGALAPSMHDTAIMYNSSQEQGDLINVHDWYNCFKLILLQPIDEGTPKRKRSSKSKKAETSFKAGKLPEVAIQARFCRAVTELQITGLLRMQSKRRPDYIQRVAFGL